MERTPWTERKFQFECPEGWIFNIKERLRGTTARLLWMTASLPEDTLVFRPGNKWSIKEHIGHLIDLEELHEGRMDDFLARVEILRAADMTNEITIKADHNTRKLEELLTTFMVTRSQLIAKLEDLDDETHKFKALHPRLEVLMRPVDVAYFTAEHDDHHLASMREIIMSFSENIPSE